MVQNLSEKIEFICKICSRKDFKNVVALKVHEHWHEPGYRENISEKMKLKWKDPTSKYNSPVGDLSIESSPKEKLGEVIKFNNHHLEYLSKYLKTHDYFDQKSIVGDYIKNKFNGNRIQLNERTYIENSFNILIKNSLETGKIEYYKPPIYRKKRDKIGL